MDNVGFLPTSSLPFLGATGVGLTPILLTTEAGGRPEVGPTGVKLSLWFTGWGCPRATKMRGLDPLQPCPHSQHEDTASTGKKAEISEQWSLKHALNMP